MRGPRRFGPDSDSANRARHADRYLGARLAALGAGASDHQLRSYGAHVLAGIGLGSCVKPPSANAQTRRVSDGRSPGPVLASRVGVAWAPALCLKLTDPDRLAAPCAGCPAANFEAPDQSIARWFETWGQNVERRADRGVCSRSTRRSHDEAHCRFATRQPKSSHWLRESAHRRRVRARRSVSNRSAEAYGRGMQADLPILTPICLRTIIATFFHSLSCYPI